MFSEKQIAFEFDSNQITIILYQSLYSQVGYCPHKGYWSAINTSLSIFSCENKWESQLLCTGFSPGIQWDSNYSSPHFALSREGCELSQSKPHEHLQEPKQFQLYLQMSTTCHLNAIFRRAWHWQQLYNETLLFENMINFNGLCHIPNSIMQFCCKWLSFSERCCKLIHLLTLVL